MIGLDTSAIIDIFRGDESIKKLLGNIKEPLIAAQMSYLELMFGLDPGNLKHTLEERYYDEFFESVITFRLDNQSCKKASQLSWRLKKEGKTIDQFECVIAGIFLAHGVSSLISKNAKHFESIHGLKVIGY